MRCSEERSDELRTNYLRPQFAALIASDSPTKLLTSPRNSNTSIVRFHATRFARRRINEEGNCEVIPGAHDGLVPIAQTTYVVNGNVEGYAPLDQSRFPKIAREFPQNKWIVLRNYDGHYKICHEHEPTHIYGSLGLAREFMATLPEEERGNFGEPPFIPRQPGEVRIKRGTKRRADHDQF